MESAVAAGVLLVAGVVLGDASMRESAKLKRCVTAFYSAGDGEHELHKRAAQNSTFTLCMKKEFPDKFAATAQKFGTIEEFKSD